MTNPTKSRLRAMPSLLFSALGLWLATPMQAEGPALMESDISIAATTGGAPGGASQSLKASWLERAATARAGWYWSGGLQAENYFFAEKRTSLPGRLQGYAAVLSLEYFIASESVAALTLRPGWYFENHFTTESWDVPVEFTTGIPLWGDVDGVVGFSNGRFYHHPVPIIGVVWTANPRVRFEAVFPEPAVVFTLSKTSALRVGGELIGGGFLSDARPTRTVIEYTSYRAGVEWSETWREGFKLTVGAGVEVDRSFDFFRRQGTVDGSGAGYFKVSLSYSK